MKHKPCAHQHARGHHFGKEHGLFLSRKNKDTGIPTSCLETELWIERLSADVWLQGDWTEKRCLAVCPSGMHPPPLLCPHHLQDGTQEGFSARLPPRALTTLLHLCDEHQVMRELLRAPSSSDAVRPQFTVTVPGIWQSQLAPPALWLLRRTSSISRRPESRFRKASLGHLPSEGFSQP